MIEALLQGMTSNIFFGLGIIIIVSTILAYLAKIIKQPLIVAYIIAGVILGPVGLNLIENSEFLYYSSILYYANWHPTQDESFSVNISTSDVGSGLLSVNGSNDFSETPSDSDYSKGYYLVEYTVGFNTSNSYHDGKKHEIIDEINLKLWKSLLIRMFKKGVQYYMFGTLPSSLMVEIGAYSQGYYNLLKSIKKTLDPKYILSRGKFKLKGD